MTQNKQDKEKKMAASPVVPHIADPRAVVLRILNRIDSSDAFADILMEEAFREGQMPPADRGLVTEIVYGVLRWRLYLDWVISATSSVKLSRMEREILNILRMGGYQILFLDRIPVSAAVNESVKLAKKRGQRQGNFVNAVLRGVERGRKEISFPDIEKEPLKHISVRYSHPEWMVKRFMEELGVEGAIGLCLANNAPPPLTIRVNTNRISRDEMLRRLLSAGFEAAPTGVSPYGLVLGAPGNVTEIPGFRDGLWSVQDEASQLVAILLAPRPGERVLDLCAAPGGKATHMAEMMGDKGEVVAVDVKEPGVRKIVDNAKRLGLSSIKAFKGDASGPLSFDQSSFDRILVDAPCSGSGVIRRHPEGKWQKREEDIAPLAKRQSEIMDNAARYLKPGGVLVYSVCSIMREEGRGGVDGFLSRNPVFSRDDSEPDARIAMVCRGDEFKVYSHTDGMDGFFASRMKRVS